MKMTRDTLGDIVLWLGARAVEIHMDISEQPFCLEIHRKMPKRDGYHLD